MNNAMIKEQTMITLHTHIAQNLFTGSWKKKQYGLVQFAHMVRLIQKASQSGDVSASEYLQKIAKAIKNVRIKIKEIENQYEQKLATLRGIHMVLYESKEHCHYPLVFSTPLAYMGAYLLADSDYVLRQMLTYSRIGIEKNVHSSPANIFSMMQNVFRTPMLLKSDSFLHYASEL